jgi:hypothetical protein
MASSASATRSRGLILLNFQLRLRLKGRLFGPGMSCPVIVGLRLVPTSSSVSFVKKRMQFFRKVDLKPSDIALLDGADGWSASFVRSGPSVTPAHIWPALARVQAKYRPTHFK